MLYTYVYITNLRATLLEDLGALGSVTLRNVGHFEGSNVHLRDKNHVMGKLRYTLVLYQYEVATISREETDAT